MKRTTLTSLIAVAGVAALAPPILSYTTIATWTSFPIPMSAAATSFPPANSYRTALETIEDRYFFEQPSDAYFSQTFDDPSIGMNNGQNEVWFSSDPAFSPAVTFYWTTGGNFDEADIIFYNGDPYYTSMNKTSSFGYGGAFRPFETTAMHEYGHAAGLGHEADEYNIMGQDWDHVHCNGSTLRSYLGEDASDGLSDTYGTIDIEDVSVSLFKYTGASGAYSAHDFCKMYTSGGVELPWNTFEGQRRYELDNGQTVQVEFTWENSGQDSQTSNIAYYISTNSTISTLDTQVFSTSISQGRADVFTRIDTFAIPTNLTEDQTYYLGAIIDWDNGLSEAVEVNNAAYHIFQVTCEALPSVSFFNAGTNPASFTSSLLTLNDPYTFTVDVDAVGHTNAVVFGFESTITLTLAGGQTLLALDGNGEVLMLSSKPGPTAIWNNLVPNRADLCGYFFSAQAIHFGGVVPFALSNARDIIVGN